MDTASAPTMCASSTRRLKACVIELVVMKPKRIRALALVSFAARSQKYMTRSAESGTSRWAARSASTYPYQRSVRIRPFPIYGGFPTTKSAAGHAGTRGLT